MTEGSKLTAKGFSWLEFSEDWERIALPKIFSEFSLIIQSSDCYSITITNMWAPANTLQINNSVN